MRSKLTRALLGAVLLAVAATGAAGAAGAGDEGTAVTAQAADVTIVGRDFSWTPANVTIQTGDTVTWTNAQGIHNVVVDGERLNNPGFPGDDEWREPVQKTFTTPGSYLYLCEIHGQMTGTITVDGGGEPTPTPTPTPTPDPVPPPGGGSGGDTQAPTLSNVSLAAQGGRVRIGWTVSEPATLVVRLTGSGGDVQTFRSTSGAGTWSVERRLAPGGYTGEAWAVDAWGNRSATQQVEVGK